MRTRSDIVTEFGVMRISDAIQRTLARRSVAERLSLLTDDAVAEVLELLEADARQSERLAGLSRALRASFVADLREHTAHVAAEAERQVA